MTTLLEALAARARPTEERTIDSSSFSMALVDEATTAAGVNVNTTKALGLVSVYAAIGLIADAVATMPVHGYKTHDDTRQQLSTQPPWVVRPNPETDIFQFVHRNLTSRFGDGNSYNLITGRDRLGFPAEIWNLNPDQVEPRRQNGDIVYGWGGETLTRFGPDNPGGDVVHIKGFDNGGLKGLSPIAVAKEAIGLGLTQEEYAARFFSNSALSQGVVEHPGAPSPEQIKQVRQAWNRQHRGAKNAHRVGILTGGATWNGAAIPNDEAQFLESRRYTVGEIARLFRIPPHLIGDVERSTSWGTGIEEQNRIWFQVCLLPEIVRLESAFNPTLARGQYLKWNPAGLLRADMEHRYKAYQIGRYGGWMSGDEIRRLEDMEPAGLDDFWQPTNVTPEGLSNEK